MAPDQLRDFAEFAEKTQRQFVLVVQDQARISDELLEFAAENNVQIYRATHPL